MNRVLFFSIMLVLAAGIMAGCSSDSFHDGQIVLQDANGAIYYPGALIRFESTLDSGTGQSATKSLSILNIGTKAITLTGSSGAVVLSNQTFIPRDSSPPQTPPPTLPFSVPTQPADVALEPGEKVDFILRFGITQAYDDGEALATLTIPASDSDGDPVKFAYEVYGLMAC